MEEYAKELEIEVIEVANIYDAMAIVFGKEKLMFSEITPPEEYVKIMTTIAEVMCQEVKGKRGLYEAADELIDKANKFSDNVYAKASFCFNARVVIAQEELKQKDSEELTALSDELLVTFDRLETELKQPSIKELNLYGVVKDRIRQGKTQTEQAQLALNEGEKETASNALGFRQRTISECSGMV